MSLFPSVCSHETKPLSSYFSSLLTSPRMLTCSLCRNSWPFNFLWTSFGTSSQPSTDWIQEKLFSSLPDESWSSESVGISLLDAKFFPGLPGGEAAGELESWNKTRELTRKKRCSRSSLEDTLNFSLTHFFVPFHVLWEKRCTCFICSKATEFLVVKIKSFLVLIVQLF